MHLTLLQISFYHSNKFILKGCVVGALAKFRISIVIVNIYVRLSVRGVEQLGSHGTDFHEFWYLFIFLKFVEQIPDWLKSAKSNW